MGLAAVTIWFASAPVTGTGAFYLLAFIWPVIAIAWAASLVATVQRGASRIAATVLAVGAVVGIGGPVPIVLMVVFGSGVAIAALLAAVGLFGLILVIERPRRIVWVVAPAIVLATVGLTFSGVPRIVRFALAEPALTAYANDLLAGTIEPVRGRVRVGSVTLRRARIRDGCAVFTTTSVGVLADSPAGIAYCPNGPSSTQTSFEPFSGNWYRW